MDLLVLLLLLLLLLISEQHNLPELLPPAEVFQVLGGVLQEGSSGVETLASASFQFSC